MKKNNFIVSKMKEQSFAITYNKILVKVTRNNCRWDEVYRKIIRKPICFLNISRVCMFPTCQRNEKERKKGKKKKKRGKIKETSTPLSNNNCEFIFPLSAVHILDNKPAVEAKLLLAM